MQEHAAWGAVGASGLAEMFEAEIEPATPEIAHAGD
jgi:hypothetical protein